MQQRKQSRAADSIDTETGNLPVPEEIRWQIYSHLPFFNLHTSRQVSSAFNRSLLAYEAHITSPKMIVEYLSHAHTADGQAFLEYYHHSKHKITKPLQAMTPMEVFAYTMTRRAHCPELISVLEQAMQSEDYGSLSDMAKQHLSISLTLLKLTKSALWSQNTEDDFSEVANKTLLSHQLSNQLKAETYVKRKPASFINLAGMVIWGAFLTDIDLSGAYMPGAKLQNMNLSDIDLSEANLSAAVFSRSALHHVKLYKTNLRGAFLDGIRIGVNTSTDAETDTDFSFSTILNIRLSDNIKEMIDRLNAQLNAYNKQMACTYDASKTAILIGLARNIETIASQMPELESRQAFLQAAIDHDIFLPPLWENSEPEQGCGLQILIALKKQVDSDKQNSFDRPGIKN